MIAVNQLRRAARRLLRAPTFSLATVLALTLGIGATTTVFSLVNGVLLRPLPYARPEQLVDLSHTLELSGVTAVDQSDASYLHYRAANRVFAGVGAYQAIAASLGGIDPAGAERVTAARVSAGVFRVLGVGAAQGRVFAESEDLPGEPPVALIGERLWKRRYGADRAIVGRRIEIDGVAHEVIGILPAAFHFPAASMELWLPIGIDPGRTESATFAYRAVARLRDGVTPAHAAADLQRLLLRLPEAYPGRLTGPAIELTHMRAVVRPLRDVVVGDVGRVLWVVLGAVGCVLLIACANVANLFLVRAEARHHDLAVARALGAGPRAVVAEFLSEGLVLAALGGALGLAVAAAGGGVLRSLEDDIALPRLAEVGVDGAVLAIVGGITMLAALAISLIPALRSARVAVWDALGDTGRSATAGRRRHLARFGLVVAQMALALVLVAGAGLMARTFGNLRSVRPGFDAAHAHTFRVALPAATYPASGDAVRLIVRALDDIAALPGVVSAGAVSRLPLDPAGRRDTAVFVEDAPPAMNAMPNVHQVAHATPAYFDALGIPLVQGRTFERPDPMRATLEVIVTRALAVRYWQGGQAVGRRVRLSPTGPWFTVVAVSGDIRGNGLEQPPDETIYLPLVTAPGSAAPGGGPGEARFTPREITIVARSAGHPEGIAAAAERTARALAPGVPVYGARSMAEVVAHATARTSFTLLLLGIASAAALAIGAVGIFGVMSYLVELRQREIAIRIALGARPQDVRRMVERQAAGVAVLGIAVGLVAALAMTRSLSALLFEVTPSDPVALTGAVALLSAVAAAATWLPARRAAAVNPADAFRAD